MCRIPKKKGLLVYMVYCHWNPMDEVTSQFCCSASGEIRQNCSKKKGGALHNTDAIFCIWQIHMNWNEKCCSVLHVLMKCDLGHNKTITKIKADHLPKFEVIWTRNNRDIAVWPSYSLKRKTVTRFWQGLRIYTYVNLGSKGGFWSKIFLVFYKKSLGPLC